MTAPRGMVLFSLVVDPAGWAFIS